MKVALIHFQPPEYYPPLINVCEFLSKKFDRSSLSLFTNSTRELEPKDSIENTSRVICFNKRDRRFKRFIKVLYFNLFVTFQLFKTRPSTVLYFETSSSFPAFLYLLVFSRTTRLFIHYHEYTSLVQYKQGMVMDRIWHFFEIHFLYKKAYWISHTNHFRIKLFLGDYKKVNPQLMKELPNFPPQSWIVPSSIANERMRATPYRMVQLGSISTKHMYARELFDWVQKMNGLFLLDIYSFTTQPDVATYLQKLNSPYIQIKGSINYGEIPEVLLDYDIGVVLYKAHSENFIYNASNKVFEYLALGLDVWISKVMLGSAPYLRSDSYPKVSFVDFENLESLNWKELIDRDNLSYCPSPYYMELIYEQLTRHFA